MHAQFLRSLTLSSLLMLAGACASAPGASHDLRAGSDSGLRPPVAPPVLAIDATWQDASQEQATPPKPAAGGGGDDAAAIGKKLSNPASDVWALFTEFDFNTYGGRAVGTQKHSITTIFQPICPVPLTKNWKVITRLTIPIFYDEPTPARNLNRRTGIGNTTLPLLFSPNKNYAMWGGHVMWGAGPTFGFPTSTTPSLGERVWELGPAAVVVHKTPKSTVLIFPQYWWSYAEKDSDASHTSRASILYGGWYELGNAWQIGTSPTATFNNEATSGNKWNIPIGLAVAKTMKFGKRIIKFQLAFEQSVVSQDDYGRDSQIRFNVIPVIQDPFGSPIF